MRKHVIINSQSSGKFEERTINGRPHLVTRMVSIEGDTVMNRLFYPNHEVVSSYMQLNRLPAPAAHPVVDGRFVSASDPAATNAHNVGAFVLEPKLDGKQVVNELAVDTQVAEKDERGVDIMQRIRNGERIGVSTGLNATMVNVKGQHNGEDYDGILSNLEFDHVAILLNEKPAGKSTWTQNEHTEDVLICNLADSTNELRDQVESAAREQYGSQTKDGWIWVADILLDPLRAVLEFDHEKMFVIPFGYNDNGDIVFTGEGTEVERKVTFEPVGNADRTTHEPEGTDVDKEKIILAIIGNSANTFTGDDRDRLNAMSESELINALAQNTTAPEPTVEDARRVLETNGLTVNAEGIDAEQFDQFVANKAAFDEFMAEKDKARKERVDAIVKNSKMTEDDLKDMDDEAIERIANSLIPEQDYSGMGGGRSPASREGGLKVVDFS